MSARAVTVLVALAAGCGGKRTPAEPPTPVIVAPVDAAPAPAPVDAAVATTDPFEPPGTRTGVTVVTSSSITVLDPVKFIGVSARLDPSSGPMLDAVAATINGDSTIRLLEVHAYGDDAPEQHRKELGEQRALAIVGYLVYRGVAPGRLVAVGIAAPPAGTRSGTEFLIVRRD